MQQKESYILPTLPLNSINAIVGVKTKNGSVKLKAGDNLIFTTPCKNSPTGFIELKRNYKPRVMLVEMKNTEVFAFIPTLTADSRFIKDENIKNLIKIKLKNNFSCEIVKKHNDLLRGVTILKIKKD